MVTTTRPVTPRLDSPERWARALDRARATFVTVTQDPVTGVFTASSRDGQRRYRVSWYACECHAAQGADPVCCHRAAFREHCRQEDRDVERLLRAEREAAAIEAESPFPADPFVALVQVNEDGGYETIDLVGDPTEPEVDALPEANEPPIERCWKCRGTGMVEVRYGFRSGDYVMGGCSCALGRHYTATGRAVA